MRPNQILTGLIAMLLLTLPGALRAAAFVGQKNALPAFFSDSGEGVRESGALTPEGTSGYEGFGYEVAQGVCFYAYCHNDPVNRYDYLGLQDGRVGFVNPNHMTREDWLQAGWGAATGVALAVPDTLEGAIQLGEALTPHSYLLRANGMPLFSDLSSDFYSGWRDGIEGGARFHGVDIEADKAQDYQQVSNLVTAALIVTGPVKGVGWIDDSGRGLSQGLNFLGRRMKRGPPPLMPSAAASFGSVAPGNPTGLGARGPLLGAADEFGVPGGGAGWGDFGHTSFAAKTTLGAADDVIHVTPSGVAFPPGPKYQIPKHYVENPHRTGNYGEIVNGKYVERLRIDPPTPPGMKGPNHSHYHLDGKGTHYSPRPGDKDPGFAPRTSTN